MPESDKPSRPRLPAWMEKANLYYGSAFDVPDKEELSRAIHDFTELSDAEQRFTLAHLLYLNLQAQASGVRLLRELRDTLDEVSADVGEGLDMMAGEVGDDGDAEEQTAEREEPMSQADQAQAGPAAPSSN